MIDQEEQDACDAAWADVEQAERRRWEDEALERSRVLTERLVEESREFQMARGNPKFDDDWGTPEEGYRQLSNELTTEMLELDRLSLELERLLIERAAENYRRHYL